MKTMAQHGETSQLRPGYNAVAEIKTAPEGAIEVWRVGYEHRLEKRYVKVIVSQPFTLSKR
jgi:hypothetical protein